MLAMPEYLQFETSTICAGKCTFCPKEQIDRPKASDAQIAHIIETCVPFSTTVCPFLYQEPSQEPRLLDILRDIKRVKDTKTVLFSNMAHWTDEQIRALVESGNLDEIKVSLYGPTPELYAKYQPGFDWRKTRHNVRYLYHWMVKLGVRKPFITMQYLCTEDLMDALPIFQRDWEMFALHIVPYDVYHGTIDFQKDNLDEKYPPKNKVRTPCNRLWTTFNILSTGDVVPCCVDFKPEMVMGNIHTETPQAIWNSEKFTALREMHVSGRQDEISLCAKCEVWKW